MYLIDRSHVRLLLLAFFDCMNKTGSNEPPPKRDQRATPDADLPTCCFCRFNCPSPVVAQPAHSSCVGKGQHRSSNNNNISGNVLQRPQRHPTARCYRRRRTKARRFHVRRGLPSRPPRAHGPPEHGHRPRWAVHPCQREQGG